MRTILDFVTRLTLSAGDQQVLLDHVHGQHFGAAGPNIGDACNESFRQHLKANMPAMGGPDGMSWEGYTNLERALDQGFTAKEAYVVGIPSIGIVAVLIANVTFVAWVTPPGGANAYWSGCNYPLFTAFLILNGCAFVLSVAATVVVTAFPLVLSKTPHRAASWGGILLMLSMLVFIVAFLLSGYVTVGHGAPPPNCASLRCTEGGIPCKTFSFPMNNDKGVNIATGFALDNNVASLNSLSNSSSSSPAVCLSYDSWHPDPTDPTQTTLMPFKSLLPGVNGANGDGWQLLTNDSHQRLTVCISPGGNVPDAFGTGFDHATYQMTVGYNVSTVESYLYDDNALWALVSQAPGKLQSYASLTYFCMTKTTMPGMQFNVLCDGSHQNDSTGIGGLSVSRSGQYITLASTAESGAVIFAVDKTATQVSKAIHTLSGAFAVISVIIVGFLVRSRLLE